MFLHYRTQAIVLKKENRGEADQLFTIFSKDFGKLEVLGKGIRKITSKLKSGIEIFSFSEIEFVQGKNYKILTDAILLKKLTNIKNDLEKFKIAFLISKVGEKLIPFEETEEKIWHLFKQVFEILNNLSASKLHLKLLYYYFFWNLLSFLGYKPELYFCLLCQKRLEPNKLYFTPEGGIICKACFKGQKSAILIKPEVIKILRKILDKDWKTLQKLKIEKRHLLDLEKTSKIYLMGIKNEKSEENI